jgi:hypothetical protein
VHCGGAAAAVLGRRVKGALLDQKTQNWTLGALGLLGLAGLLFGLWARSAHQPTEPIAVAERFLGHLQQDHYAEAWALTAQGGYTGATPQALQAVAAKHSCRSGRVVGASPLQTHGNRLRRALRGQRVDMDEVRVEFEGTCLLGVRLRWLPGHGWRVVYFASHAG